MEGVWNGVRNYARASRTSFIPSRGILVLPVPVPLAGLVLPCLPLGILGGTWGVDPCLQQTPVAGAPGPLHRWKP